MIAETRPDYVVVLPWNLVDEISTQLDYVRRWGAKLIVPIPTATILWLTARRKTCEINEGCTPR